MHTLDTPYLRVAGGFGARLALVSDQQWHLPTPCTEWTVKELTNHVVNTHQRVYVMAVSSGIEGIDDAESIIDRWAVVSAALRRARFDPTLRRTPVTTLRGEQTFSELIEGLLMFDTLCHTWDLARAIGADETLDSEAVQIAHEQLGAVSAAIRVPGGFADELPDDPDADAQTRFLLFAGRAVSRT